MAATSTKLKMKIGEFEFEAEGPAEAVAEQFRAWKELISGAPAVERGGKNTVPTKDGRASVPLLEDEVKRPADQDLQRMFDVNHKTGSVSLHVRPSGSTASVDAVMLILYGFKELLGQDHVLVTKLVPAVKKSGLPLIRVDRLLEAHLREGLVQKGGRSKGGKYSLSNTGIARAKEILARLKA